MLHIIPLLHLMQHFSSQISSFPQLGKNNKIFVATFRMSTAIPCQLWYLFCFFNFIYTQKEPVACTPALPYPL